MSKTIFSEVNLSDLVLDKENPRFAELYRGSDKEEDLIEYLLYTESGDDIARNISQINEFYLDRPLWVIKQGDKYLVKDGNRRCAAVKALRFPGKYGLTLSKIDFKKLPVLIYKDTKEIEKRVIQEHTSNLFREWGRIAKALEVYKLHNSGSSIESMKEIDTSPSDLIKLASFYYEAVGVKGDDVRILLRKGRSKNGGKTIVFERLFRYRKVCGYNFKNGPSYKIEVTNKDIFEKYIEALVKYLKNNPDTTHKIVDDEGENFLKRLREYGFKPKKNGTTKKITIKSKKSSSASGISKVKKTQVACYRTDVPIPLEKLVKECYDLDRVNFSNAKVALTRIVFECTLKFVVENTEYTKGNKISESKYFHFAFYFKNGTKRPFTDFTLLKKNFTDLIVNTGKKQAFGAFDLDRPSQIIHNYNIGAIPADAEAICNNLTVLLEFLLQEDKDLVKSLDVSKL